MSTVIITADEVVTLSIDPASITDREGNPATVENVTWATSDATKVSVEPSADGLSCLCVSHLQGEATILVEADADLGAGVKTISGSQDISVTPGQAAKITVNAGTPTPKDAPVPEPVPEPAPTA
jgi:hypothetical protein